MGVSSLGLLGPLLRGPARTMRLFIRPGDEFGMKSGSRQNPTPPTLGE